MLEYLVHFQILHPHHFQILHLVVALAHHRFLDHQVQLHLAVFLGFVYFLCSIVQFTPRRAAAVVLVVLGILLQAHRAGLL